MISDTFSIKKNESLRAEYKNLTDPEFNLGVTSVRMKVANCDFSYYRDQLYGFILPDANNGALTRDCEMLPYKLGSDIFKPNNPGSPGYFTCIRTYGTSQFFLQVKNNGKWLARSMTISIPAVGVTVTATPTYENYGFNSKENIGTTAFNYFKNNVGKWIDLQIRFM